MRWRAAGDSEARKVRERGARLCADDEAGVRWASPSAATMFATPRRAYEDPRASRAGHRRRRGGRPARALPPWAAHDARSRDRSRAFARPSAAPARDAAHPDRRSR